MSSGFVQRLRARARREVLDALDERGIARGMRITFPARERCRLERFEEGMPGPGEVLVETVATAVSAGTERAIYLGRAGAFSNFPHVPGYSNVGRVVAAGPGAVHTVGTLVVGSGPHASLYRALAAQLVAVPEGVDPRQATLAVVAGIAQFGLQRGGVVAGLRIAVIGLGIIGQLTARIAIIGGAQVIAVARRRELLDVAATATIAGAVDTSAEPGAIDHILADVVVDVTGNPDTIHDAVRAAAPGGRIVLLGSPRGRTEILPLGELMRKEVELVGAHTSTAPTGGSGGAGGEQPVQQNWATYLGLVATGRLVVADLLEASHSPDCAEEVYQQVARRPASARATLFDWTGEGPWRPQIDLPGRLRLISSALRVVTRRKHVKEPEFALPPRDGRVIRFGLIGCGEIAEESASAIRAAANATIVWTCDPERERARRLAAATEARYTTEVDELLRAPEVDAVLISTPHHLHAPLAIRVAEAGKHIVVEKPMANSVAEAERMRLAAQSGGVHLTVCYSTRFDPRYQHARRLIQDGAIGELVNTRIEFTQSRAPSYYERGLSGRFPSDWRSRKVTAGGGVLIMNACHLIDVVGFVAGSPIDEVVAYTANRRHQVEVEDTASLTYRYRGGALGSLDATTAAAGPATTEIAFHGTSGLIHISSHLKVWSDRVIDGRNPGRWYRIGLPREAARRRYFEAVASALLSGHPPPLGADEAVAVQRVIEAAYRSADQARPGLTTEAAKHE
jgi:2-desacetyl-2-hydroxyethyl bacteriochlorophyllide A dehydrogenase